MPGRDKKTQLGVRVPPEVKEEAARVAAAMGVSLNQWIEGLIRDRITIPVPVIDGQTTIDEQIKGQHGPSADTVVHDEAPAVDLIGLAQAKPFAPNCSSRAYHWKHGPGNPCRFCGGEVAA